MVDSGEFKASILTAADLTALQRFLANSLRPSLTARLSSYLTVATPDRLLCGVFNQSELVGVVAIYYMTSWPWACVPYMKTGFLHQPEKHMRVLTLLVDFCFAQIEARGCNRVFMANELRRRGQFMNAKLAPLMRKIPRLHQYSYISEGYVAAGCRPRFPFQWQLLGEEFSNVDMGFVSVTKKEWK